MSEYEEFLVNLDSLFEEAKNYRGAKVVIQKKEERIRELEARLTLCTTSIDDAGAEKVSKALAQSASLFRAVTNLLEKRPEGWDTGWTTDDKIRCIEDRFGILIRHLFYTPSSEDAKQCIEDIAAVLVIIYNEL